MAPYFLIMRYGVSTKFLSQMNDEEKTALLADIEEGLVAIDTIMENRECDILIIDEQCPYT